MSVLILAAHPDDEVLGCGGTIASLTQEGQTVDIAIFGEGATSRHKKRRDADDNEIRQLKQRSRAVARLLGARKFFAFGLPDNRFDTVPLLDIVKKIEQLIDELKPSDVYTQHGGDLNLDHQLLYRATLTATRPMRGCPVRRVYAYEVASSTEWSFQRFAPVFNPNVFVEITGTLKRKLAAMQIYETEARKAPHPRSPEALTASARRWGSVVGVDAAEAFELVREIR